MSGLSIPRFHCDALGWALLVPNDRCTSSSPERKSNIHEQLASGLPQLTWCVWDHSLHEKPVEVGPSSLFKGLPHQEMNRILKVHDD